VKFVSMIILGFFTLFIFIAAGIFFFQEKLIFFPDILPPNYKYVFEHKFEEINFDVEEQVTINALHFKAENSKGIVYYSHGNSGCLQQWGSVADIFIMNNYDFLIYDYRGYGKSSGTISESNLYHDAIFIYKQLLNDYKENEIIIYGRSIGTGIATKVASEFNPKHLVLESPYYNLPDLVKKMFPFIPSFLLRYKFRNDQMIKFVTCPVTIIHGTFDEVIYFGASQKLEKLFMEKDSLIPIIGGHHNDLADFEIFRKTLANIMH